MNNQKQKLIAHLFQTNNGVEFTICNSNENVPLISQDIYKGSWIFEDSGDGCESSVVLEYDAGVPLVGPLIKKLIKKVVIKNLEALLNALAQVAEKNERN